MSLRRIVAGFVLVALGVVFTAGPAQAVVVESDVIEPAGPARTGGFGAFLDWLESLFRPVGSFLAMDGAKITEGG